ncbi:MAG TPA: methyltransferase domain-containing protein [Actinomycetes bacterium]
MSADGTTDRERLAATFDADAERYERARPRYPAELFADLGGLAGLAPGARVLEVGPGTGQATRGLLAEGWRVVAVERGPALAAVARRELAGTDLRVDVGTFETWPPDGHDEDPFDAVVSATAWHWVDPDIGYRHATDLLGPGGSIALIGTTHVLPADGDPFFVDVQRVYARFGEVLEGGPPMPADVADPFVEDIAASGLFHPATVRRYLWPHTYTAEEYVDVLSTYSNTLTMPEPQRRDFLAGVTAMIRDRPGGTVTKHYLNHLVAARRL